jgi:nitrate/TMAO reductase-like tetraheme cytochrome c subunit
MNTCQDHIAGWRSETMMTLRSRIAGMAASLRLSGRRRRIFSRVLAVAFVVLVASAPLFAQSSPHGQLSIACEKCHSSQGWKTMRSPLLFDHKSTGFVLVGQHATVQCASCHSTLEFAKASTRCAGCHEDIHRGELGGACDRCHSPSSWLVPDMVRRHAYTRFSLVGAHASASCQSCHKNEQKHQYGGMRTDCYGCHSADFAGARSPDHKAAGFSTDCTTCHKITDSRWGGGFDHNKTNFALTGAHRAVACVECHTTPQFASTSTVCYTCHRQSFETAANPKHGQGFSTECVTCHSTTAWRPATFNHSTTRFALVGTHVTTPCASCHKNNVYTGTPMTCGDAACHLPDYNAASNPAHLAGNFSKDCQTCHTANAWQPASFDHSKARFQLTGSHTTTPCASCHKNNVYTGTPMTCGDAACHLPAYNAATNPAHLAGNFSKDCQTCHTTNAWQPATFDHSKARFQLTGSHTTTPCASCHKNNVYTGTPMTCGDAACHLPAYNTAMSPPHLAGKFSTDCTTCHNTNAWQPSTFNHSTTSFTLTGAHVTTPCASCHKNGVFAGTPMTCGDAGCHLPDYNGAMNPAHLAGNFSKDCLTCHTTNAWQPASFDHSKARFQLTGAHINTPCAQCHKNNVYTGTPMTCGDAACHLPAYNATTNPAHLAGNFSKDCSTCHTTNAWQPATFDHSKARFALTGAHVTTPCASCHKNNVYTGTPMTCGDAACHLPDYTATNNPAHAAGKFSTDCTGCHNTNAWQPSTFNHASTGFTLTGAHASTSVTCIQCHKNNVYPGTPTTCGDAGCHLPDYNATNNPVHSTAGFSAGACASCHNTTSWANATFNHTWFPQNHGNSGGTCTKCHLNPADYAVFSCIDGGCHPKANTDNKHNGRNNYSYSSPACYNCHPRGNS